MGRRECPCQAERRAREEQAAFLKKKKDKEEEEEAGKQEERKGNRLFGFGLLRNLQKSLFGSNLNLSSVNSSNGQPKGKRGSYRALAQEEPQGLVNSPGAAQGVVASSDMEDSATSPDSMASAISTGSRMSTTRTESPVVITSRLPTIVSLREEDYDWGDEELTCNVCDRSFLTPWDLDNHMIKRRHWGCSACERLFNTVMELEHHKEEHGHWSDEEEESDEEEMDDLHGNQ